MNLGPDNVQTEQDNSFQSKNQDILPKGDGISYFYFIFKQFIFSNGKKNQFGLI